MNNPINVHELSPRLAIPSELKALREIAANSDVSIPAASVRVLMRHIAMLENMAKAASAFMLSQALYSVRVDGEKITREELADLIREATGG